MRPMRSTHTLAAVTLALFTALSILAWAAPREAPGQRPWLSHFQGDKVIVTFITATPDMSRTTDAVLMDAEDAGIVLRFGKEEVFFSFANIMTVEPAR